ncbi:hypothetical protein V565_236600 [Rhizoctonia solani 123E]|uniref:DUF6589 domain-containing protein n=1 Tax=Rhizoctonia solani 123E TaxID=1423351 RepID=A0A074RMD3_9AGAM|nr:hypothetical protein V565_236600 [Rhizoctonia solani 123E]
MPNILDDILSSQPTVIEDEDEPEDELIGQEPEGDIPRSVRALQLLSDAGISFSDLLDDVFLGNKSLRNARPIINARREAFASGVLSRVVARVCRPPDMQIQGKAHQKAAEELKDWANTTTTDILRKELATHAKSTKVGDVEREVVNEESLKGLTFDAITDEVQANAPTLYSMLVNMCESTRQEKNTQKDSKFCVTLFVNALAFQLSHKNNQMQKLICIYLKAKGVPKSCFSFFQKAGLSLSYEWSRKALEHISAAAMDKAIAVFDSKPCISVYDNIRLAQAVKHERASHKTVTDNGTAMTIVPMRDSERATALLRDPDAIDAHWNNITQRYRNGDIHDHQLTAADLYDHPGFNQWGDRMASNVIQFLYEIPGLEKSLKRKHGLLRPLPPVHQLLPTKDIFHMLEPVPMEEQTYGGNYAITKELPRQMKVDTDEKLVLWARNRMGPWTGDSLTIQRLRHLQRMKADDSNRLERMQHIIPVFGWMHLDMNLCNAIFYHHFSESSNSGLARDAAALGRSGLTKPTKSRGPAYHTVDEFMQHTTTARMRGLWLWASGTNTMEQLIAWEKESSPSIIAEAAQKIWLERASNRATQQFKSDPQLCNSIAINRELLLRHEVRYSMRHGDVGRMEHTLPQLLYFFSGAGCANYAREIAEVLHWRKYEAPPGVA